MSDIKYLWDNSTSAIFWGFFIAFMLTAVIFRLLKDSPPGSRYTPASTFFGLLMVAALSVEFISFIGAFQARAAVTDMEQAVKAYGGNAANIANIDNIIANIAPGLKRYINSENINKDAIDDIASAYADSIRDTIDKQIWKLIVFIVASLVVFPMFILKSKRFYDRNRNYQTKRSNYRIQRKNY